MLVTGGPSPRGSRRMNRLLSSGCGGEAKLGCRSGRRRNDGGGPSL
jgi:hypothetical protein